MKSGPPDKVGALRKILELEAKRGFNDRAVAGGLDKFLSRWQAELKLGIGRDPLPGKAYALLTPQERRTWAGRVFSPLSVADAPKVPAPAVPAAGASKPARRRSVAAPPVASLESPLSGTKIVTRSTAEKLMRLGVESLQDLLYLFPTRHIDYARVTRIRDLMPGLETTVSGQIREASAVDIGPGGATRAVVSDGTGTLTVTWFRQPYLARRLRPGARLVLSGKVQEFRGRAQLQNPQYEIVERADNDEERVHAGNLLPVYPSTEGLQQRTLRTAAKKALDVGLPLIREFLPASVIKSQDVLSLRDAVQAMHLPASAEAREAARRRLAFDELFLNQLVVQQRRLEWRQRGEGVPVSFDDGVPSSFLSSLYFSLTAGQEAALGEILRELRSDVPMSRLLQGEVGSGKTVVAVAALLAVAAGGFQGALMAPTEVLAEQHFINVCSVLRARAVFGEPDAVRVAALPGQDRDVRIALLIGSLPTRVKAAVQRRIASGEIEICVGTHALIQDALEIPKLALAVVDEQHRFGVEQRAALKHKGLKPHLLAMSATPIPRSLALTLYGDLDLSTLRELPRGRRPIETRWATARADRATAYELIRTQVAAGRQVFVVCPLIDPSEEVKARSAVDEHSRLSSVELSSLRVGLLHGRMPLAEKQVQMERFRSGEIQVLVATPVIEVGIDIPNASVMVIESADRFGLSQLHQLRGRVGRGEHKSYCFLMADEPSADAQERLALVARSSDGFDLADADLRIRGPGDYVGTRQSGFADLKVANLGDLDLLAISRAEAETLLAVDPSLRLKEHAALKAELLRSTSRRPAEIS